MADLLRQIIAQNRAGSPVAIPSVCSAHPDVLEACLHLAGKLSRDVVIEATSNQANQEGGYTGMQPLDFINFVKTIAQRTTIAPSRIVYGGDHLGPQAWRNAPAAEAMTKAHAMVAAYAKAGFTKIHLDCSEGCLGEPAQLTDEITAERSAALAATALASSPSPENLLFVIGTEVPPPGGAQVDEHGELPATTTASAKCTLDAHAKAFDRAGLGDALQQVGGLVVQPGVEFSPFHVHHLPVDRDPQLLSALSDWPNMCLEAHSTDYQFSKVFPRLAKLGFAFQKVGPALTYSWRQALYALDAMRMQCGWQIGPSLADTLETAMLATPKYWQSHYRGENADMRVERHFGLADRIRYYWPQADVQHAVARLFHDLEDKRLPASVVESFFSSAEIETALQLTANFPRSLALARVQTAMRPYFFTVEQRT